MKGIAKLAIKVVLNAQADRIEVCSTPLVDLPSSNKLRVII